MSMDSQIYRDFVKANLKNNGVWCSIDDAIKTKQATIAGKIIQTTSGDNLCYDLVELYPKYNADRVFQIRFSKKISLRVSSLSLKQGDCFAVYNAKIDLYQPVCEHSKMRSPIDIIFVDPMRKRNFIENIYYKRQNSFGWSSVPVISSLADKSSSNKCMVSLFRIDLNNAKEIAACVYEWHAMGINDDHLPSTKYEQMASKSQCRFSSPELFSRSSAEQKNDEKTSVTNVNSQQRYSKYSPKVPHNTPSRSESYFKPLLDDFIDKNMPVKRDIVWSQTPYLTKLVNVMPGDRVNVIVILTDVPKKPLHCASDKYILKLNVSDDSGINEFLVRLIRPTCKDFPVLKPFNIMLFNGMKIDEEKRGSVGSNRSVVVFDKENPCHVFGESNVLKNSVQIQDRVEELRQWMFKTIPISRPFTSFGSFELKNDILNLRCRIVKAKEYSSATTMILRVEDGTVCTVAVILYALNTDCWSRCYDKTTIAELSNVIDILVREVQKKFVDKVKSVKENEFIELYGVSARIKNIKFKTTFQHCLELSLVGDYKNLLVERNNGKTEPQYQKHMEMVQSSTSFSKANRSLSPSYIPIKCIKRRRLLDDIVRNLSSFSDTDEDATIIKTQRRNQENSSSPSSVAEPFLKTVANDSPSKSSLKNFGKTSNIRVDDCQPSTPNKAIQYLDSDDENENGENGECLKINMIEKPKTKEHKKTARDIDYTSFETQEVGRRASLLSDKHKTHRDNREKLKAVMSKSKKLKAGPRSYHKRIRKIRVAESFTKEVTRSNNREIDMSVENRVSEIPCDSTMHLGDKESFPGEESVKHVSLITTSISESNECPSEMWDFTNNDFTDKLGYVEELNLTGIPLGNDIVNKWPDEVKDDQLFRIRARLKMIVPNIDRSSNDKDLLRLVYTYCEHCNYHPMNLSFVKWTSKGNKRVPLCRTCLNDEKETILEFLFICDLLLEDSQGTRESVLAQGPFANKILGCTLKEFNLKLTRRRVQNRCHQLLESGYLIVSVQNRVFHLINKTRKYFLK